MDVGFGKLIGWIIVDFGVENDIDVFKCGNYVV